jgi:hypothetical protein
MEPTDQQLYYTMDADTLAEPSNKLSPSSCSLQVADSLLRFPG